MVIVRMSFQQKRGMKWSVVRRMFCGKLNSTTNNAALKRLLNLNQSGETERGAVELTCGPQDKQLIRPEDSGQTHLHMWQPIHPF